MVEILKYDDLVVDSENTLFYLMISWLEKSPERQKWLPELLEHVRFAHMSKYFLLDVIPYVAKKFPEVEAKFMECRRYALQYIAGGSRRLFQIHPHFAKLASFKCRSKTLNLNSFRICHEFKDISALTISSRLYSKPFLFLGYEFYYFLRPQPLTPCPENTTQPNETFTIAGFLRCTSAILPSKHYLPISSTVSIKSKDGPDRKFNPSRVVFEASEKAIGGKLTLTKENLAQIISGECPIVINDTIHITVEIELLDSKEEVQVVNEVLAI